MFGKRQNSTVRAQRTPNYEYIISIHIYGLVYKPDIVYKYKYINILYPDTDDRRFIQV